MQNRNKYRAKKVRTPDGMVFDSIKEYKRWQQLSEMQKRGEIKLLQRQVKYELIPSQKLNGKLKERNCCYVADFVYTQDGDIIVEDVKSAITRKKAEYIIKRKLLLWRYGIVINEV